MPERYTLGHHESVLRSHRWRTLANSAAYLAPTLKPGMRVLDIGSGPGTITVEIAEQVYPGKVVGIDASEDVIAEANALAKAKNLTNLHFRLGDAYAPNFSPASFDMIHAHQVLQHLGRPVAALTAWRALLAPGGVVAARDCDYAGAIVFPDSAELTLWQERYLRLARSNSGHPDAGRRLKSWAQQAGFITVNSSASLWCFENDTDRAWWGGLWADRAHESEFASGALEKNIATREELAAIRSGWLWWAKNQEGWMILPHGEILASN